MRQPELENICQAVESGDERLVQNLDLRYVGRALACDRDRMKVRVEAFGHRFVWDADRCREVGSSTARLGPPSSN